MSEIPWNGPIGGVQVGLVDGKIVLNPTQEQRKVSAVSYTPLDVYKRQVKEFSGLLTSREGTTITLEGPAGPMQFELSAVSTGRLCDDEDLFD